MNWKIIRLGEVIKHRKGSITIDDSIEYKLCRVQLHRRGVALREILKGSLIKTKKQQLVKGGDFLVAEMDAKLGGYGFVPEDLDGAIVSSHYFLFELDENEIRPKFLEIVSKLLILQNQIKAVGSTNYSSIRPSTVLDWEIPITDIEHQKEIENLFIETNEKGNLITEELLAQLDLVKQLRQSFLREAMQGKLLGTHEGTEEKQETGQQLLEKIKAEKLQLIKDKKLKKEKELPPIKPEEIPFEIPGDWVWCRLGEVALYSEAGRSFKCVEVPINEGEWGVIKVSAVSWDAFLENQNKLYSKTEPNDTSARIENGDFLISRANTSELVGKSVVVKNITKNLLLSDKTIRFRFSTNVSSDFLNFCNNLKYAREYYAKMGTGSSPSMKNITRVHMNNLVIPLPPHFKQNLILNRIEHIQLICNQLEASIKQSQQQNEQLLQQVLREALEVEEVLY